MENFFSVLTETVKLVICAAAVATISMTLAKASIFASVRERVAKRSAFFGKLLNCPYCTSHWAALFVIGYFQPRPVSTQFLFIDLVLSWLTAVAIATFFSQTIGKVYDMAHSSSDTPKGKNYL